MKKITFLGIAFILIISILMLAACQSTPAPTPTTPASTPTGVVSSPTATTPSSSPTATSPASPTTSQKTVELTFSYHAPPQASLATAIFVPWAKEIEEASSGRIKITHYPGGTLVSSNDAYDAVATGLCDIAQVDTEQNPGRFPLIGINQLPFFYPDTEVAGRVSHELLNKYALDGELKEVKLLITAPIHNAHYFGNKPVEKLEDFKNLKIRASGKVESSTIDALGGVPVDIGTGDVFSALDRGTIDGCFFAYSGALSFGIKDATKYRTECNIFPRVFVVAMNKAKYDSLPADLKQIIDKYATPEVSQRFGKAHQDMQAGPRGAIVGSDKQAGNPPIYVLPADEVAKWKATVEPTWQEWAAEVQTKGLNGSEILAEAKKLIEQYSAQ